MVIGVTGGGGVRDDLEESLDVQADSAGREDLTGASDDLDQLAQHPDVGQRDALEGAAVEVPGRG